MDRAERPEQPDLVDPERADGDRGHQGHPDPADGPVRQRALGGGELDQAEHERRHRRKGMERYLGSGIEQWRKAHDKGSWQRPVTKARDKGSWQRLTGSRQKPQNRVLARDCNILTGDREIQPKPLEPESRIPGLTLPPHHTAGTGAAFTAPVSSVYARRLDVWRCARSERNVVVHVAVGARAGSRRHAARRGA